jgi:hypothetical protein
VPSGVVISGGRIFAVLKVIPVHVLVVALPLASFGPVA